jgi:ERCC4-type nuclease
MDLIQQNPKTNPEVIIGYLASVLARHKVTIMFVGQFYVPFVVKVIEKLYDGKTKTKQVEYVPTRRKPTLPETKVDIISRIPKIGVKKGNILLEHFDNSICKLANASEEEILKIPGFGPKLSKQIMEIFK